MRGLRGVPVCVEADVANGLPVFTIVGLTDRAIQEARERVRAAVRNSGFEFPSRRLTVNLAPAELPKEGTAFDLAIAVGVLNAGGLRVDAGGVGLLGELALDGSIRPIAGVLPMVRGLAKAGFRRVVVPAGNAAEAALVQGVEVVGAASLAACVGHLGGGRRLPPATPDGSPPPPEAGPDLAEVRGQAAAKRTLEIAAAGGHNLLMLGPPGSGKTMLARCAASLLPDLSGDEALDVAAIYSLRGAFRERPPTTTRPPFRAPHHSVSRAGLIGGGAGLAQPGEVSLAHRGVLFLDEFCEFPRGHLEALRQPLEEHAINIARARGAVSYPAQFSLIAAANPCPCGHAGDSSRTCRCDTRQLMAYTGRLSGPIRDRIDLVVDVPRQAWRTLFSTTPPTETSTTVRCRVEAARGRQAARGPGLNAALEGVRLRRACSLDAGGTALLAGAGERLQLSARAYHRVLRVARTIADLGGSGAVTADAVAEALRYRGESAEAAA
ncbi:MAG: YifB family Mg chelatase-like AAA ATPase [Candidatus Dormibacteria bacterium]